MLFTVGLVTTLCDPTAALAEKIALYMPSLRALMNHVSVVAPHDTAPLVLARMSAFAHVELVPNDVHQAGAHRRRSVELALHKSDGAILYADLDHLLRWVEREPHELQSLLAVPPSADLLVVGRTADGFRASPERVRRTESIVNGLFRSATDVSGV